MGGSPLKIEGLLGMLTIRLQEDNFVKWSFQFQSVLEGYDLFDYFDGTNVCPPKYVVSLESRVTTEITAAYREWIKADKAFLSLSIAALGDEVIEYVVGSKTAYDDSTHRQRADSIEKYLLRLKHLKDQLLPTGESISDNDLIVAALAGLPSEYNIIKTVIVARESVITLKEFRVQLLSVERTTEEYTSSLQFPMIGMFSQGDSSVMGISRQYYQGDNSNKGGSNGGHFYQGESSTTCASRHFIREIILMEV
ncbi:uncharacterized protein LOC125470662 [Pyrus x bretschneideri]|uniref:uncharacterized protein LOC125470662 n=1 Tax=Pyrus x bretschneideri TaxID=225117 RepID=UPI00202E9DF4|nr:uncharacterized protein LOC125470662 [Pyrus x bretschneideri]